MMRGLELLYALEGNHVIHMGYSDHVMHAVMGYNDHVITQ